MPRNGLKLPTKGEILIQVRPQLLQAHGMTREQFIQLRVEWLQRLEQSGFRDIERCLDVPRLENPPLRFDSSEVKRALTERDHGKTLYYQEAGQYLWEASFQGRRHQQHHPYTERAIWKAHCSGMTPTEIYRKRKRVTKRGNLRPLNVNQIKQIIRKIRGRIERKLLIEANGDPMDNLRVEYLDD